MQEDCYTVDVFSSTKVTAPADSISEARRAFAGVWENGAWNGSHCHDLYVIEINEDGSAVVIDTHGPGNGSDATAFRRTATFDEADRLVIVSGNSQRVYELVEGELHAVERVGKSRERRAILTRRT
ncbi:MAG: hypothetical protein AAGE18_06795 [Pseudomonadota bacterium]